MSKVFGWGDSLVPIVYGEEVDIEVGFVKASNKYV